MGAQVSSGAGSKQDYSTPDDFLEAAAQRFGPIQFDLAAHAMNTRHERYFAPSFLVRDVDVSDIGGSLGWLAGHSDLDSKELDAAREVFFSDLGRQGADVRAAEAEVEKATKEIKGKFDAGPYPPAKKKLKEALRVHFEFPNLDKSAWGFDSFAHQWAPLTARFGGGPLWLNCEFSDIVPWKRKCREEMKAGASILSLTPAVITNWFRDLCAGTADIYLLNGRLCFDGKNVFPKDCMVSHFHERASGRLAVWDWKRDVLTTCWELEGNEEKELSDESRVSGVQEGVDGEGPI